LLTTPADLVAGGATVSLLARFEGAEGATDRRAAERRDLRLAITASLPESPELAVTIHDLSESGLLLETLVPLTAGQVFELFLPLAGAVETKVVWNSHNFYGCQFSEKVPRAAVSAALLQSAPEDEQIERRDRPRDVLLRLRDVNARIEQVAHDLDQTIEELSARRSGVPPRDPDEVLAAALPQSQILPPRDVDVTPGAEPEHFYEPRPLIEIDAARPVIIISLILVGLAVLILIAALLGLPLPS
jgi:hypothetical protein